MGLGEVCWPYEWAQVCVSGGMNQAALNFDSGYPANFFRWLQANSQIYNEFERRALRMARAGRKHYSARTIVEAIRWNTDMRDSDALFKINGNYVPGMSRLFMETHGEQYPGFFQLRDSLGQAT